MSGTPSERAEGAAEGAGEGAGEGAAGAPRRPLHARSFKLRFAARQELGRSHVSAVKPLALPATVTDKLHRREAEACPEEPLRRVQDMFRRGPRDKYDRPLTTSQEYGWWQHVGRGGGRGGGPRHHIRDSAWLKARVRVLAAGAGYQR